MKLKDIWKNKVDEEDLILAEDINSIAQAVIDIENKIDDIGYISIPDGEEIEY